MKELAIFIHSNTVYLLNTIIMFDNGFFVCFIINSFSYPPIGRSILRYIYYVIVREPFVYNKTVPYSQWYPSNKNLDISFIFD